MQSRKELAEAGRRKLEEFRKAKAQGKASTSKAAQDTSTPSSIISNAVAPQFANGNGVVHLPVTPGNGAPAAPSPSSWLPGADSASTPGHAVPNGLPVVTSSAVARSVQQPLPSSDPAPQPSPVVAVSNPTSATPGSPPPTTFVVLQDAPIPFGGPAQRGPGPEPNHGPASVPWSSTPAGGGLAVNAPQPSSYVPLGAGLDATSPSAWPWDSPVAGAAEVRSGAAASSSTYAGSSGLRAVDGDVSGSLSGGVYGTRDGLFGQSQPGGLPPPPATGHSWATGTPAAPGVPYSEHPGGSSTTASLLLQVTAAAPASDWTRPPASSAQAAAGPEPSPAAPEPAAPHAVAPLESKGQGVATDEVGVEDAAASRPAPSSAAARSSPVSAPETSAPPSAPKPPGFWGLGGLFGDASSSSSSAPSASAAWTDPRGGGYGGSADALHEPNSRPPWLASSAAAAPAAASAPSADAPAMGSTVPVVASPLEPPPKPAPSMGTAETSAYSSDVGPTGFAPQHPPVSIPWSSTPAAVEEKRSPWTAAAPSGLAAAADAGASTSAYVAADTGGFSCYDQLSDRYLGASSASTAAAGSVPDGVGPRDSAGDPGRPLEPSAPATSARSPSPEPRDGTIPSGESVLPPLPVSVAASSPFSSGLDGGAGSRPSSTSAAGPFVPVPTAPDASAAAPPAPAPTEQSPPWSSTPAPASSSNIPVPPPARPAPTTSRFAWLFGSPPSGKEPLHEVPRHAAAPPPQLVPQPQSQAPPAAAQPQQTSHGSLQPWGLPPPPAPQPAPLESFAFRQPAVAAPPPELPPPAQAGTAPQPATDGHFTVGGNSFSVTAPSDSFSHAASHSSLSSSAVAPFMRPSSPLPGSETTQPAMWPLYAAAAASTQAQGLTGFGEPASHSASGASLPGLAYGTSPASAASAAAGPSGMSGLGSGPPPAVPGSPNAAKPQPWGSASAGDGPSDTAGARTTTSSQYGSGYGSAASYGGGLDAASVSVSSTGRDAAAVPAVPSFIRDVDRGLPAPGPGGDHSTWDSSLAGRDSSLAGPTGSEVVQSVPSFGTSFAPASTSAAGAALPPLPHSSGPRPSAPPAAPPPAPPPTSTSATPHFNTAASYLSAYSSAPSASAGGGATFYGGPAAAAAATSAVPTTAAPATTTASFLDAYLDNLLSTMSAQKDASGDATGQGHKAAGAGITSRNSTPRPSNIGDQPPSGEASVAHPYAPGAQVSVGDGVVPAEGAGGELEDRGPSNGDLAAAGGSGGEAPPHLGDPAVGPYRSHHSRRVSVDSSSGMLHSALTGNNHSHAAGSGVSRAQFAALQQHIDELTEEKLALTRGLQQQTRINGQLVEENEELMRQYNARGAAVEELQRKVKQYEQELEAQALSLEGFSEERHAARSSYAEASSRAQALAAEVVGLEAQVLQLKSAVLKAERAADEAQQRSRKLEKQVETLTKEAHDRAQELQQTQLKGRNLVVKLKQTEAKLQAAEEKLAMQAALAGTHGLLPNGHHLPTPAPPPPPKPTVEQEVQCELAAELEAEAEAARAAAAAAEVEAAAEAAAAVAAAEAEAGQGPTAADGASVSSGAVPELALLPQSSVHSELPDAPERLVRIDWDAVRPNRDAPSAVVAERALADLDPRELRAAASAARDGVPEGLDLVALQLARWLPAGPVSGGDPVAVMVEEELRLMQSIHELLGGFEAAQEAAAERVAELQERVEGLTHENDELRRKLELQTQRLELEMQGVHAGHSGQVVSLHQTPALQGGITEGANPTAAVTPVSGPYSNYQPSQSFVSGPADSEVVTPTRSTRAVPLPPSSLEPLAHPAAQSAAKQTWMGYLFRPRQKKRTRSSLL